MRAIDGVEVDGEADVIGDVEELDHSTVLEEVGCIADSEDVGIAENCEIFAQVIHFSCADEYD